MRSIKRKIREIQAKVDSLPSAKVSKHWRKMQAAKESDHGESKWKKNPIKVVSCPNAITVFRQLPKKLKSRMWASLGVETEFDPKELVTYQPCISAAGVISFVRDRKLLASKRAYVLGTESGPCIWNGNHRAVAAILSGEKFIATYLDLSGDPKDKKRKR
jgi:hypothetical protein